MQKCDWRLVLVLPLIAYLWGCEQTKVAETDSPPPKQPAYAIEKIAHSGHGMFFDEKFNNLKLDEKSIVALQSSTLKSLYKRDFKLDEDGQRISKLATELLKSQDLKLVDRIMLQGVLIDAQIRQAPTKLKERLHWRNITLIRRYYIIDDLVVRLHPDIWERLREILTWLRLDTDYMADCRANDVPIPPDWKESGTDWVEQGDLTTNMLADGDPATVYTYRDPAKQGACIALPRTPMFNGIICQSATTGHACFWDNISKETGARIDWRGATLEIDKIHDGSILNENCTSCHQGNNVFNIAPDDATWAKVLRGVAADQTTGNFTTVVNASTDNQGGKPRYIPITTNPPRPGWVNTYTAGGCAAACHESPRNQPWEPNNAPSLRRGWCSKLLLERSLRQKRCFTSEARE